MKIAVDGVVVHTVPVAEFHRRQKNYEKRRTH